MTEALAAATPWFFEHRLGEMTALFERRTAEVLRPHQERANELIESVRRTAPELFDVPYRAPENSSAFEMVSQPSLVTHTWSASLGPIPASLVDAVRPPSRGVAGS